MIGTLLLLQQYNAYNLQKISLYGKKTMDILNRLVALVQLRSGVDVMCRFQGSWYVRHAASRGQGVAHVVTEGSGFMRSAEGIRRLQAGDVVFFRAPPNTFSAARQSATTAATYRSAATTVRLLTKARVQTKAV